MENACGRAAGREGCGIEFDDEHGDEDEDEDDHEHILAKSEVIGISTRSRPELAASGDGRKAAAGNDDLLVLDPMGLVRAYSV